MENNNKLCSSSEHEKTQAYSFCRKCEIYMCKKCETLHSKLLKAHKVFVLEKNNDEIFSGFCNEKKHQMELEFFCKTHNQLRCAACLSKIKKNEIGQHKDCDACLIEEIKEEKIKKLKENIQFLEKLSENIVKSINEIKIIIENIDKNKEQLKMEIRNVFTKVRNELNNREDELLLELDNKFNDLYFNDEILKKCENLPNKIKLLLEKWKKTDNEIKNDKLNLLINQCLYIENKVKDINIINENIQKCKNSSNMRFHFYPQKEKEIQFLENIKTFGRIFLSSKIKEYNLKKSLNLNSGICSVIVLSNNDIAIGKRNGELMIYNSEDLKEIAKVQAHSDGNTSIYSLLELKDKSIITCGGNKTMKNYIYNINDKKLVETQELYCKDNSGCICRAIELPNNNLVSSDNNNILIWKRDQNNKFKIIKEITDFGGVMQHLTLINDKYVVCHNNSGVLRIYNSGNDFKLEKEIKNLTSYAYMHRFCIINSELFCLSGDQNIYLISISKMELVNNIRVENMNFHSILLLSNNSILCGAYENKGLCHFYQFQIDENNEIKQISKQDKVHSTIIWQLAHLKIKDNIETIISVSDDNYIKIFDLCYEN